MSDCWFAFYPGDHLRDTVDLSLVQHGAYMRLLAFYYSIGAPLTIDKTALYRITGAQGSEERAAVDSVINRFFALREGAYHNGRADREIIKRHEHHTQLSESGRRGANKRWAANNSDPNSQPSSQANGLAYDLSVASPQPQPQPKPLPKEEATACAGAHMVPPEIWRAFVEHRKKLRSPLTAYAGYLIQRKLERLNAQGHDPVVVLQQSIEQGWKGIFPVRKEQTDARPESFAAKNIRRAQEELSEVCRDAGAILSKMEYRLSEQSGGKGNSGGVPGISE